MIKNKLSVAEVFYSIQGEGITMGCPSVFLRLGGCNLLCQGSWICDTIAVWRKSHSKYFQDIFTEDQLDNLSNGAHLVITGGEPLLQQNAVLELIKWLRIEHSIFPFIEIETNGTIAPDPMLMSITQQWNCSPKLSNSGESYERRVNEVALRMIQSGTRSSIFKFVINDRDDFLEIEEQYGFLDHDKIVLMPAGDTQNLLDRTREMVVDLCKVFNYRYSERLQVVIWNKATGV